jgi:hypothetical protein
MISIGEVPVKEDLGAKSELFSRLDQPEFMPQLKQV